MNNAERLIILNRIRRLSRLMDTAIKIPVINVRIGLDPILGLVPGAGDLLATCFSLYILYLAFQFQLPQAVWGKMLLNIGLEAAVGTVPLVGDLFDAFYKSNVRNLEILEQYLRDTEPNLTKDDPLDLSSVEIDDGQLKITVPAMEN
ncbi:MAG: DUF4112 domain-containing protein [Leptolyngbyaceae cyanobacterium SL_7_1]|nr:DUF4112 domain-containing protein [Leptolyngbyaceae cyanobacterium SL_7_1]